MNNIGYFVKISVTVFFCFFFTALYANERDIFEERSHYIKAIGTNEGLTQPYITAVHTDSDGNVWIGTRYRLNRYVNGNLSFYDDTKLSGSRINMLFEDSTGKIWVGTESGLSKYDRETDIFVPSHHGNINCALEYNGKIYFAGRGDILIMDMETGNFSFLPVGTSRIIKIILLKEGVLLFADKNTGLYSYDIESGDFGKFNVQDLGSAMIQSIDMIDGNLYVGVYLDGLYILNPEGRTLKHYSAEKHPGLSLEVICDISIVDSRICLATDGSGICTIEGEKIVPIISLPEYSDLATLPSTTTFIHQDSFSNIWVGSVKDGMFGIKHTPIRHIAGFDDINSPFGKAAILCMCADEKYLWIGTEKGILRYCPADKSIVKIASTDGDIISSVGLVGDNKLLISIYCKGLYTIDKKSGRKEYFSCISESISSREKNSGFDTKIFNLSPDDILIAGENVYRYNAVNNEFSILSFDYGITSSELHPFYSSDKKDVYAYSHTGIFGLDISKNHIYRVVEPKKCGRINTSFCKCGKFFIGTDTGLLQYDPNTSTTETVYPGVFHRITHIVDKGEDEIWIVTDDILYSYNCSSGHIEMFDEAEGFISKEVAFCANTSGCFCFAGNHNISFVPYNITRTSFSNPSLALYKVDTDDASYQMSNGDHIKLPRNSHNVQLDFKLLKSDPFRHTLVRYYIKGDATITEETYENCFRLPPLGPGKYSVWASVFSLDGNWGEEIKYLDITIPDMLLHRKWFMISVTLIILAIVALIIRKVRVNADRKLAFAILRNKEDDKSKRSRFIKGIEAEMRKPLSQISRTANSILVADVELSEKTRERLDRICAKSQQIEDIIRDAVGREQYYEDIDPVLSKFNDIVEANISNTGLNVATLVREMAMSRSVLYEKIKDLTGMGINEYVQKYRITRSRKLLIETDMELYEISEAVGFSSLKYFSEVFKTVYGMSPREFRKNLS